ncbi:MAG: hypothetical protein ACTHL5_11355 [Rhodanobacter sp.]
MAPIYHEFAAVIGWQKAVELGQWVYENRKPPCREAGRNYDHRGFLAIPKKASARVAREIAAVIGEDATRALQAAFGGAGVYHFGSIEPASITRRNRAIVERLEAGFKVAAVACAFDLAERVIRRIYQKQTGKPFKRINKNQEAA